MKFIAHILIYSYILAGDIETLWKKRSPVLSVTVIKSLFMNVHRQRHTKGILFFSQELINWRISNFMSLVSTHFSIHLKTSVNFLTSSYTHHVILRVNPNLIIFTHPQIFWVVNHIYCYKTYIHINLLVEGHTHNNIYNRKKICSQISFTTIGLIFDDVLTLKRYIQLKKY